MLITSFRRCKSNHSITMPAPDFLCYRQAYRKRNAGKITEEEYIHEILQHLIWEHDCADVDDDNDTIGYAVQ